MPSLTPAVRIAASSILLLSLVHILFFALLAVTIKADLPPEFPYNYFFPILCIVSAAGLLGVLVAAGLFHARNWARIAAIALAAIVAFFCAFGILVPLVFIFGLVLPTRLGVGVDIPAGNRSDFIRLLLVYLFVFCLAIWWIFLFSKKRVVAQFSANVASVAPVVPQKPACPPPIALLAWLMIISSALSALSWPLVLGRIPAMLFTHIFYAPASSWIWAINLIVFLACGVGLLKLQRWGYDATLVIHVFWTVSLFFSQLSPNYPAYIRECLLSLQFPSTINDPTAFIFPYWLTAILSVVPTLLLVVGLLYYRKGFLKAAAESSGHKAA